jgi:hypothetical protein
VSLGPGRTRQYEPLPAVARESHVTLVILRGVLPQYQGGPVSHETRGNRMRRKSRYLLRHTARAGVRGTCTCWPGRCCNAASSEREINYIGHGLPISAGFALFPLSFAHFLVSFCALSLSENSSRLATWSAAARRILQRGQPPCPGDRPDCSPFSPCRIFAFS